MKRFENIRDNERARKIRKTKGSGRTKWKGVIIILGKDVGYTIQIRLLI